MTASAGITRWAIALMGCDYVLKWTAGERIPHTDALNRRDFDKGESGTANHVQKRKKEFEQQKHALTIYNGIIFSGVVPFIPPKLRHLVLAKVHKKDPGKNATEASVRMIAWRPVITQELQHFASKCKKSQINRPSLGEKDSTWPEFDVWERLHID